MKTLILVRHAKSSWDSPGQSDSERPLNERGRKDAPEMAKRLKERGIKVDLLVTSPAKRARQTAKLFAEEYGIKKEDILVIEDLYMATQPAFKAAINRLDNRFEIVLLFSHNPGITEFASSLTNVSIDDMPTCAMYALQVGADKWKDFEEAEKQFLFFDYPKNPGAQ
jgi:phosphohistidine phosphatase